MEFVELKSSSIVEDKECFSRVVALDNWLFMSLTGRGYKPRCLPETALGQANSAMKNVEGVLAAVGCGVANVIHRRIFFPLQEDVPEIIDAASCVSCGPMGGPEYRFEIESNAYRSASALSIKNLSISL